MTKFLKTAISLFVALLGFNQGNNTNNNLNNAESESSPVHTTSTNKETPLRLVAAGKKKIIFFSRNGNLRTAKIVYRDGTSFHVNRNGMSFKVNSTENAYGHIRPGTFHGEHEEVTA